MGLITLAAVYAARIGLDLGETALFASVPILAGALLQIPVGIASDRFDRRIVLVFIALGALGADVMFVLLPQPSALLAMAIAAMFGATVFAMYPVITAHASDHTTSGSFIQISGGLLLVSGIGSAIGPMIAGLAMTNYGPQSLYVVTGLAHALVIGFAMYRLRYSAAVAQEDKGDFQPNIMARAATPETAALWSEDAAAEAETKEP